MSGIKETFHNTKTKITENVEKTGELLQLKAKLNKNEAEINRIYKEIGESYFDRCFENPLPELRDLIDEIAANKHEEKILIERKNMLNGLKTCKFCGQANKMDSVYCTNCGKPLQDAKKVCGSCGETVEDSMLFCPKCGRKLTKVSNEDCPGDL